MRGAVTLPSAALQRGAAFVPGNDPARATSPSTISGCRTSSSARSPFSPPTPMSMRYSATRRSTPATNLRRHSSANARYSHSGSIGHRSEGGRPAAAIDLPLPARRPIATIAFTVRRDALRHSGTFDESWSSFEDWDLYLRLVKRSPSAYLPESLAVIHVSRDSLHLTDAPCDDRRCSRVWSGSAGS